MRDFKQQLKAYGNEMNNFRCPYSEAEIDRKIRKVIWNTTPNDVKKTPAKYRLWSVATAAAIVVAIIIPATIFVTKNSMNTELPSIEVDGGYIYYACNNGCSPDETLKNLKDIIR